MKGTAQVAATMRIRVRKCTRMTFLAGLPFFTRIKEISRETASRATGIIKYAMFITSTS